MVFIRLRDYLRYKGLVIFKIFLVDFNRKGRFVYKENYDIYLSHGIIVCCPKTRIGKFQDYFLFCSPIIDEIPKQQQKKRVNCRIFISSIKHFLLTM